MIIWGSYVTKKIIETGKFYCPGCTQHRTYNLRRPKKWGHLYWIPLIPMEEFERYVECTTCNKAWNEAALKHDPVREQRERDERLATMIAQTMALMSQENGLSMRLAGEIAAATRSLVGVEVTPEATFAIVSKTTGAQQILSNVAENADYLTDRGKELVLQAAISVARIQPLDDGGRALAVAIGQHLKMTSAHVTGVLAEASVR